jgi:hypothetical protein
MINGPEEPLLGMAQWATSETRRMMLNKETAPV